MPASSTPPIPPRYLRMPHVERGMQVAGDVRTYDFGPAIAFWIGSSAVSMILAATLWRVRLRE